MWLPVTRVVFPSLLRISYSPCSNTLINDCVGPMKSLCQFATLDLFTWKVSEQYQLVTLKLASFAMLFVMYFFLLYLCGDNVAFGLFQYTCMFCKCSRIGRIVKCLICFSQIFKTMPFKLNINWKSCSATNINMNGVCLVESCCEVLHAKAHVSR